MGKAKKKVKEELYVVLYTAADGDESYFIGKMDMCLEVIKDNYNDEDSYFEVYKLGKRYDAEIIADIKVKLVTFK